MPYGNYEKSKLKSVAFLRSDLSGSFFSHCKLTAVTFADCALTQSSFVQTPLKGLDLTTDRIGGLTLSEDLHELRGVTLDLYQSADLARRLGAFSFYSSTNCAFPA